MKRGFCRVGLMLSSTRARPARSTRSPAVLLTSSAMKPYFNNAKLCSRSYSDNAPEVGGTTSEQSEVVADSSITPQYGDYVNLFEENSKDPRIIKLSKGNTISYEFGCIAPEQIIEVGWGGLLQVNPVGKFKNHRKFRVLRPTLEEYSLRLKRLITPIYPKDHGAIINMLAIRPGDHILEAGSGTGLMSLVLAREVGPNGSVTSYELRQDHHEFAVQNAKNWDPNHNIKFLKADVSTAPEGFDGMMLDVPDPASYLETLYKKVKPSRSIVCVVPNIAQVIDIANVIEHKILPLSIKRVVEVIEREWAVSALPRKTSRPSSASPVLHTAFIVNIIVLSNKVVEYKRPPSRNAAMAEMRKKQEEEAAAQQEASTISPVLPSTYPLKEEDGEPKDLDDDDLAFEQDQPQDESSYVKS